MMEDEERWKALPEEERQEQEQTLNQNSALTLLLALMKRAPGAEIKEYLQMTVCIHQICALPRTSACLTLSMRCLLHSCGMPVRRSSMQHLTDSRSMRGISQNSSKQEADYENYVCGAANQLRSDLLMAGRNLSIIRSSTTEVTAPWLLREMAPRIASTLNYFLLHLAGRPRCLIYPLTGCTMSVYFLLCVVHPKEQNGDPACDPLKSAVGASRFISAAMPPPWFKPPGVNQEAGALSSLLFSK